MRRCDSMRPPTAQSMLPLPLSLTHSLYLSPPPPPYSYVVSNQLLHTLHIGFNSRAQVHSNTLSYTPLLHSSHTLSYTLIHSHTPSYTLLHSHTLSYTLLSQASITDIVSTLRNGDKKGAKGGGSGSKGSGGSSRAGVGGGSSGGAGGITRCAALAVGQARDGNVYRLHVYTHERVCIDCMCIRMRGCV
jgi:hypothetical protein